MAAARAERSTCARCRRRSPACRRARSGATKRRSATCSRYCPNLCRCSRRCARASAVRSPSSAAPMPQSTTGRRRPALPQQGGRRAARRDPGQAAEDDARCRRASRANCRRSTSRGITVRDAAYRVLQFPAVADKTFLVTIGDRTVGGLCARDPMVGPWQVPVADVAVTLMDFDGYAGEAMAIGERTPLALIDAPASGRMAIGEAITNIAAAGIRATGRRQAVGQLDGAGRTSGRGRGALRHRARSGDRYVRGDRPVDSGRQGLDVDAHDVDRRRRRQGGDGTDFADRLRVRAGRRCARAR